MNYLTEPHKIKPEWDIDLAEGHIAEAKIRDLFKMSKIEVKYDRFALKTGNIAIEVFYKNRPSGILTTQTEKLLSLYHIIDFENLQKTKNGYSLFFLIKLINLINL